MEVPGQAPKLQRNPILKKTKTNKQTKKLKVKVGRCGKVKAGLSQPCSSVTAGFWTSALPGCWLDNCCRELSCSCRMLGTILELYCSHQRPIMCLPISCGHCKTLDSQHVFPQDIHRIYYMGSGIATAQCWLQGGLVLAVGARV